MPRPTSPVPAVRDAGYAQAPRRSLDIALPADDAQYLPFETTGFYVGGAGTLHVLSESDEEATFVCQAGQTIFGRFVRLFKTGTTATGIVAQGF